jgi:peptidoglycan/LPS O-acetylase OafA/YrhL
MNPRLPHRDLAVAFAVSAPQAVKGRRDTGTGRITMEVRVKPPRITALDFTKGALVLTMVLYHWINYFVGADWPWYFYLRFLTPSFIFVSGFVVANVYLTRPGAADARTVRRLLSRGFKLLAVFIVLNLIRSALLLRMSGGGNMASIRPGGGFFFEVLVSGDVSTATGKVVAFYILVPISYLLLLSAALLLPCRRFRYTFHVATLAFLSSVAILAAYGLRSYNLEFVTIGLLGVLIGYVPLAKINRHVAHPFALAIAYTCYLAAITRWNVPFILLVPGTALSVGVIYLIGLRGSDEGWTQRHIILLGKYSLFGYVAQIAILQLLSLALHRLHSSGPIVLALSFVAAFVLTSGAVVAVDRGRARSTVFDQAYKVVFA